MQDCTVQIDNGFINIRVGAIIIKNGKVLMSGGIHEPYYYSVGGRVRFQETLEEAVRREVFEETGDYLEIDRLGFVHENHFNHAYRGLNNAEFMELCFFFYMKTPDDYEPTTMRFKEGNREEKLTWVSFDTKEIMYPEFFKTELMHPTNEVKFIMDDNRKR